MITGLVGRSDTHCYNLAAHMFSHPMVIHNHRLDRGARVRGPLEK